MSEGSTCLSPSPLLCSTCLTSLLNMFWAIQLELFFTPILKNLPNSKKKKKKNWWSGFLVKLAYSIQIYYCGTLQWVFLGIIEIIFRWIFQSSCYMESLYIIDKFCSGSLAIFLNIFMPVIGNAEQSFVDVLQNRCS